jgi:hypothetical protein
VKYDVTLHFPSLREWYEQVLKDPSLLRDYERKEEWFLRNANWNWHRRHVPNRACPPSSNRGGYLAT